MLSFTGSLKIFIALDPIDMRAGINTLHALVADRLGEDARSGTLFVFTNKRRCLIKVLYWDGTGMWMLIKRLSRARSSGRARQRRGRPSWELVPEAFAMLTDGIDMHGAKPRGWYERVR